MDTDMLDGATCAASDLTARLGRELAEARCRLQGLDAEVHAGHLAGRSPDSQLRAARRAWRRQVDLLLRLLDGLPTTMGERHAEVS